MKIVLNKDWGGFQLSKKAYEFLGLDYYSDGQGYKFSDLTVENRTNPDLIRCVETLGPAASGSLGCLRVVEIPDDIEWEFKEYDGIETVEEKHRSW